MRKQHTYPRHSRWHPDNRPPAFNQSHLAHDFDGCCHLRQRENVGYGFTRGIIVGTMQYVDDQVRNIYRAYPPNGYGTEIHWPPVPLAEIEKPTPSTPRWAWLLSPSRDYSAGTCHAPYEQLTGDPEHRSVEDWFVLWYSHSESCE